MFFENKSIGSSESYLLLMRYAFITSKMPKQFLPCTWRPLEYLLLNLPAPRSELPAAWKKADQDRQNRARIIWAIIFSMVSIKTVHLQSGAGLPHFFLRGAYSRMERDLEIIGRVSIFYTVCTRDEESRLDENNKFNQMNINWCMDWVINGWIIESPNR